MPALSVLVPVRDAAPWLESSLASLWRQRFRDFEVVAVDDGSLDRSGDILEREARRDARLRVVRTPARGLPAALNVALALARAPLVARHDADDLSHRERFAAQVEFLARRPDIGVVGTRLRLFPSRASGAGMRRWARWHDSLLTHDAMRRDLLIDSPLAHGTAMLRSAVLRDSGGWHERGWAEDLDLWIRLFERGVRFEKLPARLYGWRQHGASATRRDPRYARERFTALKLDALDRGLLACGRPATLVGVGESLARWRAALGGRVGRTIESRQPSLHAMSAAVPLIMAFVSAPARAGWRAVAGQAGLLETVDFIFVA